MNNQNRNKDSHHLNSSVGTRIKDRRKQISMTLDVLSEKTGLTASFISQVERGKANVSLNSLQAIAEALDVPVFFFVSNYDHSIDSPVPRKINTHEEEISPKNQYDPVVHHDRRSRLVLPDTGLELELLIPNIGRKMISFKARLAPGMFHIVNHPKEPTEEIIYVILGILTLEFKDGVYNLQPDETIYFESEKLLRMSNNSDAEDTVWITTITPGIF